MTDKRVQSRLVKEVVALFVVLALLGGMYYLNNRGKGQRASAKPATPLDTQFDTNALDKVKEAPEDYPKIDDSGVGKSNPFGT